MVFHKELTPLLGAQGIRMNRRKLTLTKVVLAEVNTAATLWMRVSSPNGGDKWVPLEFLHAKDKPTAELNISIDPGETLFMQVQDKGYIGPETIAVSNGVERRCGGNVKVHLFGNLASVSCEGSEQPPPAKRARGADDSGFA
jgi:hypothetical protein